MFTKVMYTTALLLLVSVAYSSAATTVAPSNNTTAQATNAPPVTTASGDNSTSNSNVTTISPTTPSGSSGNTTSPPPTSGGGSEIAFFENSTCDISHKNADCTEYANSICGIFDNSTKCGCREGAVIEEETKCIFHIGLGEECEDNKSRCIVANSKCVYDGDGQGKKRCLCDSGYLQMKDTDGSSYCAVILTKDKVSQCEVCEANEGICYGKNEKTKEGCKCPVSKIGQDCDDLLVHVTCEVDTFTMHICYDPRHPGVNFTTTSAMYASGHGNDESCKGKVVTINNNRLCNETHVELILPLREPEVHRCGTKEVKPDLNTRRYENTLVVDKDKNSIGGENVILKTYCSFSTQTQIHFEGIGINALPGNDRGEHKKAEIEFNIETRMGNNIPEGTAVRHGDPIRFLISLTADGTYAAIHVVRCTASTSPTIPDPKALTAALIQDSCPVAGNGVFDKDSNFMRVSNQTNMLQSGLVPTWKMDTGNTVFLHCTVKICLKGKEKDCGPVECEGHNSAGKRKRRNVDESDNVDVSKRIILYEDEEQKGESMVIGKTDFAVLMAVLSILLVVFVALSVVLYLRLRSGGPRVEDMDNPLKPQRFAMPRINTPHMRM